MISRWSQHSVRTRPLPSCQIAMTTPPQQPRCNGESVVFFQPRFQWMSLSPDCALYLPVESTALPVIHVGNDATEIIPEKTMADLTPRQQQVLAALKLGLPNKLIAVKLNLSENTVKMHIHHIMRKCSAHNRTEAVLRWSERLSGYNGRARSRVPLSY